MRQTIIGDGTSISYFSYEKNPLHLYFSDYALFRAACSISLGLCWKSGVAAEVIGIPKNSIGENLYNAKIYLDTPDLFAWTIVIILISLIFEKLFIYLLDRGIKKLERI